MNDRPRLVGDNHRTRLPAESTPSGEAAHTVEAVHHATLTEHKATAWYWIAGLLFVAFLTTLAVAPAIVIAAWRAFL